MSKLRRNWARHGLRELAAESVHTGVLTDRAYRALRLWTILHSGPRAAESTSSALHLSHLLDEGLMAIHPDNLARDIENINRGAWPECDGDEAVAFIGADPFCPICAVLEDVVVHFYESIDWIEAHRIVLMDDVHFDQFIDDVNDWLKDIDHPGLGLVEFEFTVTEDDYCAIGLTTEDPLDLDDVVDDGKGRYDY